ncbi:MAG: right-handed parallel beta-helix repeat-containing protein [Planctomycetota bacterium]
MRPAFLLLLLTSQAPTESPREVRVATIAELRQALAAASPGTGILVAPGQYEGFFAAGVHGAPGRPVVLRAATADDRPVFRGEVHLSSVSHLEIAGLTIEGAPGNGLNVDDGGRFESPSQHVVLRDLVVRDCGGRGNDDGIKLSGVDDFRLERCTVERWGRNGSAVDMVGCHRGVIEGCTFRDREEDPAANGVQMKGGTRDVAVRGCRFEHAGTRAVHLGGSTALQYFRPRPEGFEAGDLLVAGCTFVGSEAPVAFVGVDGATVRWNTFYRPRKWFARILQETREPGFVACRGGVFSDNLVAYRASEVGVPVNVGTETAPETFRFVRNYWHCLDDPKRGPPEMPTKEGDAVSGLDPKFRDAEGGDLRLREDSPARGRGAEGLPPVNKR